MHQVQLCGQVERGVAVVGEVGVLEALGVIFDDAFEEGEVFEVDGSADADGDVNPPSSLRIELVNMLGNSGLTWLLRRMGFTEKDVSA